jgi:hypothetical protein
MVQHLALAAIAVVEVTGPDVRHHRAHGTDETID